MRKNFSEGRAAGSPLLDALRAKGQRAVALGRRWAYLVPALAAALRALGVGRGSTVSAMLPNTPEMVEAHYAVPALNVFVLYFALPCMLYRFGASLPVAQLIDASVITVWLAEYVMVVAFAQASVSEATEPSVL